MLIENKRACKNCEHCTTLGVFGPMLCMVCGAYIEFKDAIELNNCNQWSMRR